jgi:predicted aminopeptidase
MKRALLAVSSIFLAGCSSQSTVGYYWQSVTGHLAVMNAAKPISQWLDDQTTPETLKEKLRLVTQIRQFASAQLALPDNKSYTQYADLKRPSVVWNVFATEELSMKLKTWCFPVAGCVSYKGFYAEADAQAYAAALRDEGLEAYVAGIPAYSTLGWFNDPILNTFINYPDGELARLIFHELGHQVLYVKNDSTFNESFATAIEELGLQRWLAALPSSATDPQKREKMLASYTEFSQRKQDFVALLKKQRVALEAVYAKTDASNDDAIAMKRAGKLAVFQNLQDDYQALKRQWGGYAGYDRWFSQKLTNAHLASVATYTDGVPGFRQLLQKEGNDLGKFYIAAKRLAEKDRTERNTLLGIAQAEAEPVKPQ